MLPVRPFTGNPANHTTPLSTSSLSKPIEPPVTKPTTQSSPSSTVSQKVMAPTPSSTISPSNAPQFSFKMPIEDSSHAQQLYSMILNTLIPGITPRPILATSPDIQKLVKEDTTTRKVPSASVDLLAPCQTIHQLPRPSCRNLMHRLIQPDTWNPYS